jgi:hypothetical protein
MILSKTLLLATRFWDHLCHRVQKNCGHVGIFMAIVTGLNALLQPEFTVWLNFAIWCLGIELLYLVDDLTTCHFITSSLGPPRDSIKRIELAEFLWTHGALSLQIPLPILLYLRYTISRSPLTVLFCSILTLFVAQLSWGWKIWWTLVSITIWYHSNILGLLKVYVKDGENTEDRTFLFGFFYNVPKGFRLPKNDDDFSKFKDLDKWCIGIAYHFSGAEPPKPIDNHLEGDNDSEYSLTYFEENKDDKEEQPKEASCPSPEPNELSLNDHPNNEASTSQKEFKLAEGPIEVVFIYKNSKDASVHQDASVAQNASVAQDANVENANVCQDAHVGKTNE